MWMSNHQLLFVVLGNQITIKKSVVASGGTMINLWTNTFYICVDLKVELSISLEENLIAYHTFEVMKYTSGKIEVRCFKSMHELTQNVDHISNVRLRVSEIDEFAEHLLIRPLISRLYILVSTRQWLASIRISNNCKAMLLSS